MKMILRAFPYNGERVACQCLLYCDGKYTAVVYHSDGRVLTYDGGNCRDYKDLIKRTNSVLLGKL